MEKIVMETVSSYNEYLNKLPYGIENIANNITLENYSAATEGLINLLEGLIWIIEINDKLEGLNYSAYIDKDKIKKLVNEILNALQIEDYNLCADILNYELLKLVYGIEKYGEI